MVCITLNYVISFVHYFSKYFTHPACASLQYADGHVPGSPFHVCATPPGVSIGQFQRQSVSRMREAAEAVQVGSTCELNLALPPGHKPSELHATVTAPSGRVEDCEVLASTRKNFVIRFVPQETGVHVVNVLLNNNPIPGSPFHFTVGSITAGIS